MIEAPPLTEDLLTKGQYVAVSIDGWPQWAYRKVESLDLLDGQRGRRRVSVDCTPLDPADLGTAPQPKPQEATGSGKDPLVRFTWKSWSISYNGRAAGKQAGPDGAFADAASPGVEEPLLVPLTFMEKRTHKTFDLRDAEGRALSLLQSEDNAALAAAAVAYVLSVRLGMDAVHRNWSRIYQVAAEPPAAAKTRALALIRDLGLTPYPRALLMDIARGFILFAQLPPAAAGNRQILKFSYHWEAVPARPSLLERKRAVGDTWRNIRKEAGAVAAGTRCGIIVLDGLARKARRLGHHVRAGVGWGSFLVRVNINSLSSTRSYHLECPAPDGLLCARVELPPTASGTNDERLVTPVGHAHGAFGSTSGGMGSRETPTARVYFILDRTRLLPRVMWSAIAVAALFGLLLLIPGAITALTDQEDSATALFLFIPALLVALNARSQENFITAGILLTLRLIALGLSLLLVLAGALVVLTPQPAEGQSTTGFEPATMIYWWTGFILSTAVAIILLSGYLNLIVKGREFHGRAG